MNILENGGFLAIVVVDRIINTNLFLGTSKHVFKLWDKQGIIGKKEMKLLENCIEEMDVPSDIGRLLKKISSNCGSYTAEQWKNWTVIYSMYALKGLLQINIFSVGRPLFWLANIYAKALSLL